MFDCETSPFRAGSSDQYEFSKSFSTLMWDQVFCYLVEQCLGDQKCLTLLLYLERNGV